MKWRGRKGSDNVTSSRGSSSNSGSGFGTNRSGRSGGSMPPIGGMLGGGGGIIGIILLVLFLFLSNGGLGNLGNMGIGGEEPAPGPSQVVSDNDFADGEGDPKTWDEMAQFLKVSLKDSEDAWQEIFQASGENYRPARLHLFDDYVRSACGGASSEVGPFYCSADQTIYIDMTFYNDLKTKFGASGDFTMSYVLSHEVGHHVQNLLGILDEAHAKMQRVNDRESNEISVRLELQADYFAGVVAHWQDKNDILVAGDVEEAMKAAESIGDDTIQERTRGRSMPDTFTHGTSEQRMRWYNQGFKRGDLSGADTFKIPYNQLFAQDEFEHNVMFNFRLAS